MDDLVERLQNLIEVSEVACERDLYKACKTRIEVLEAFHAGNADMQLMLYNRIKELEKALQEIVELAKGPAEPSLGDYGEGAKAAWDDAADLARTALGEDDWHHEGDDITEPPLRKGE